ncbi:MAG TPA: uroporphyrinogen decarboxylase [Acidimicrobiia bacterium]|nr:uroporphyrinogen decarboxylase [Acidimicrobiia bacterium]
MTRRLVEALRRRPVDRTPVWIMRQAGRYLPEYRELRASHAFQEAVSTPSVAAEITCQPIRRFGMDGAVIFADIMTPLEAMGVDMTFDPGPRLRPHTLAEVIDLPVIDPEAVGFVGETIRRVRAEVDDEVAVIGFAGAPATLLAYLVEGGGSKEFMELRSAVTADPSAAQAALDALGRSMLSYLKMQADAGADVVQLFDTWAGLFGRQTYQQLCLPAARTALAGLDVPSIYFAPGAGHTLDLQAGVGADGYGVDWRIPIDEAWDRLGDVAIQGNLDPAVLRSNVDEIRRGVADVRARVGGRPGHIMNLGHGIDRHTPVEHVAAFVEAVRA